MGVWDRHLGLCDQSGPGPVPASGGPVSRPQEAQVLAVRPLGACSCPLPGPGHCPLPCLCSQGVSQGLCMPRFSHQRDQAEPHSLPPLRGLQLWG